MKSFRGSNESATSALDNIIFSHYLDRIDFIHLLVNTKKGDLSIKINGAAPFSTTYICDNLLGSRFLNKSQRVDCIQVFHEGKLLLFLYKTKNRPLASRVETQNVSVLYREMLGYVAYILDLHFAYYSYSLVLFFSNSRSSNKRDFHFQFFCCELRTLWSSWKRKSFSYSCSCELFFNISIWQWSQNA